MLRVVIPPLASHTQKALSAGHASRNFDRNGKNHAAQRGRDAFGTATRISASLLRRLSACFGSAPGQGPKAAKFAVLSPGHAGFPNHAKRSEGSDSAPIRNTPVSPCVPLCAIFLREPSVLAFVCESEHGPFVREVEKRDEKRFGTALRRQFRRIFLSADSGGSQ